MAAHCLFAIPVLAGVRKLRSRRDVSRVGIDVAAANAVSGAIVRADSTPAALATVAVEAVAGASSTVANSLARALRVRVDTTVLQRAVVAVEVVVHVLVGVRCPQVVTEPFLAEEWADIRRKAESAHLLGAIVAHVLAFANGVDAELDSGRAEVRRGLW